MMKVPPVTASAIEPELYGFSLWTTWIPQLRFFLNWNINEHFSNNRHILKLFTFLGMLLEIDNSELVHMLEHQESLKAKVEEAVVVLQAHKQQSDDPKMTNNNYAWEKRSKKNPSLMENIKKSLLINFLNSWKWSKRYESVILFPINFQFEVTWFSNSKY